MRQLLLDLGAFPDAGARMWVSTAGTAEAEQALKTGGQCVCLYGPEGSGKSHLLALAELAGWVVGDDLEALDRVGQEALFHAFNKGERIAVASRVPVAQIEGLLPDLKSRLLTGMQVEVRGPDDAELVKLLACWADARQIAMPQPVVDYILVRAARSTHELAALVAKLDALSLEQKRAVTVPLARQVLESA